MGLIWGFMENRYFPFSLSNIMLFLLIHEAIHPNQIETIYQNFRPSDEKIEFAKNIISSMKENELLGKGAFELDGKMIDQPMV